jgi:hypothetical protein
MDARASALAFLIDSDHWNTLGRRDVIARRKLPLVAHQRELPFYCCIVRGHVPAAHYLRLSHFRPKRRKQRYSRVVRFPPRQHNQALLALTSSEHEAIFGRTLGLPSSPVGRSIVLDCRHACSERVRTTQYPDIEQ